MARVFTTPFPYQGQKYTAVVSINDAAGTLSIYVPDESLHGVLPGGKVSIPITSGLPSEVKEPAAAQDLLRSLMTAIRAHEGK